MKKPQNLRCISLVLFTFGLFVSTEAKTNTVQYVTAVFRHGDRTVDGSTVYPTDPYINETYYPYGVGQLTARGKEKEYALGQRLRKRYDLLLGNIYMPGVLEAISTDIDRTKASLALVLAGLYPPKGNIMEWSSQLNWQPIPYNYIDFEKDLWFTISIYFCPNYAKEYSAYLNGPEGRKLQEKYQPLYEYLQFHTGLNITRPMEIFFVYSCLESQTEWGLKLPEWTEQVWPEILTEATKDGLTSGVATTKLKQLSGGLLIERIIDNMKAKANGTLDPEERKISLYSGHDLSVLSILGALNVYTPHVIPYGACVLIELHKLNNEHYVKVLYEDYSADQPKTLTIPGCEELCPLNKFESLLKINYPTGDNPCGEDTQIFEEHLHHRHYYLGKLHHKSLINRYIEWVRARGAQLVRKTVDLRTHIFGAAKSGVKGTLEKQQGLFGKVHAPKH